MSFAYFYEISTGRLMGDASLLTSAERTVFTTSNPSVGIVDRSERLPNIGVSLDPANPLGDVIAQHPTDRLPQRKKQAINSINRLAEGIRRQHATPGPGQMEAYRLKEQEARTLLSDPALAVEQVPILGAEAAALGVSAISRAKEIISRADSWHALIAHIEAERHKALVAVQACQTLQEIDQAIEAASVALFAVAS